MECRLQWENVRRVVWAVALFLTTMSPTTLAESGYIITASKYFMPSSTEAVCINLVDLTAEVTLHVLHSGAVHVPPISQVSTDGAVHGQVCLEIEVPSLPQYSWSLTLRALIEGTTDSGEPFSDINERTVAVFSTGLETFVQTDKPVYKAGQVVRIRILTLKYPSMKPFTEQYNEVYITSPDDIRVRQWRSIETQEGLIDLAMQLSDDPVLGTWTIHATVNGRSTRQTFKIDEYVLPKFDVIITPPSYVFVLDQTVEFSVCGLYTYGQPVRGSITVNVSIERLEPTLALSVQDTGDDGCHKFTFPLSHFPSVQYQYNKYLIIDVNFTEAATGVSRNETHGSTRITQQPLTLQISGPDGFKPGLPYRCQVEAKLPDGFPAQEKDISVTVTKSEGDGDFIFETTLTTNLSGKADLEFTSAINPYITKLLVVVSYQHPGFRIPVVISRKTLFAWYSQSGSFLAVRPLSSTYLVGQSLTAELEFVLPSIETESIIEFNYNIFANRNLITAGAKTWSIGLFDETYVTRYLDVSGLGIPQTSGSSSTRLTTDPPDLSYYPTALLATTSLSIPLTSKMAPEAVLVVFYTRSDGEIVSARQKFKVKLAFENDVQLSFNKGQVFPGSEISLNINASPGSLCAIGSVDKSILLLEDSNSITQKRIFSPLSRFDVYGVKNSTCPSISPPLRSKRRTPFVRPHYRPPYRPIRPIPQTRTRSWSNSKHVDSLWAFESSGVAVLSNLILETRPCYRYTESRTYYPYHRFPISPMARPGAPGGGPRGPSGVPGIPGIPGPAPRPVPGPPFVPETEESSGPIYQLRTHFPETWLWHLTRIGSGGVTSVTHTVPHSITDWVTTGFCTSTQDGVGVAEPISLRVFQSFFVSVTLPYSVIREEEFPLKITVFNYLSQCFTVSVRIQPSSDYSIQSAEFHRFVCVCGNQAETVEFDIIPRRLGKIPITVMGEYVPPSLNLPPCGSSTVNMTDLFGVRDAVNKTVLVEAEGSEVERTTSFLICPHSVEDGSFVRNVPLEFPVNIIPDTESCKVQITGNVLGPVLTNLGSLLRMPTGCGEQNMVGFTPNIFVLIYLNRTNQQNALPDVYSQAEEYMRIGYERELQYRLSDGSYSAFGERDGEGSTWLTAFVLKSFALASEFIDIDNNDLQVTRDWLVSSTTQNEDTGCFNQRGRVIHKSMQGGHTNGVTLTAYATIALLEAAEDPSSMVMFRAIFCLTQALNEGIDDTYTLAIVTYALAKADYPFYGIGLGQLNERAENDDGKRYWVRDDAPPCDGSESCRADPAEIEMTAYALLTYLEASRSDPQLLLDARLIVEWLNEQRNSHGGFTSTQDTVIGLQALALYAELVYSDGKDVSVDISTTEGNLQEEACHVTSQNDLVMYEYEIHECPNNLRVFAEGEGCVLFQTVMQFNLQVLRLSVQYFDVQVGVRDYTPGQDCSRVYLDITISYIDSANAFTNMAVVDVKMVSGYSVDTHELDRYLTYLHAIGHDIGLMRYDHFENGKPFSLYFNQFTRDPISFVLVLKKDINVKNSRDAFIKVFDYYEAGVVTYKSYHPCQGW